MTMAVIARRRCPSLRRAGLMFQDVEQTVGNNLVALRLQVRNANIKRILLIVQQISQIEKTWRVQFVCPLVDCAYIASMP